jgi:hypothetical protein
MVSHHSRCWYKPTCNPAFFIVVTIALSLIWMRLYWFGASLSLDMLLKLEKVIDELGGGMSL